MRAALVGLAIVATAAACSMPGTASSATPSARATPNASPVATTPATLDPAVTMPAGFPADLPIYPKARLTEAASFAASGAPTVWGVEWETLDSVAKVRAFYAAKLGQGDWTITFSGTANGAFAASYARRSNKKVGGLIGAQSAAGVTRITLSLSS